MTTLTVTQPDPKGPTYKLVNVTPQLAKKWLAQNTHNRNLRERVVNSYAADMLNGHWAEDGQSIKFSTAGILLDGQHRLSAIAQSGTTQRMLVVTNLTDTAQDTMDTGARRSLADVLKLHGESNFVTLAAALLRVHQWQQGHRKSLKSGGTRPTNRQLLDLLGRHPEIRRSAEIAERTRKTGQLPGSTVALCHWLFVQIDPNDCAFFFARLADGAGLMSDDPIYALRRALENHANAKGRPEEAHVTALVIKGWNAYRDGRTVHLLAYRPGGASPEPYPEPK
jgi:hypothetical protein